MPAVSVPEHSKPSLEKLTDQALLEEFGELVRQDQQRVAILLRHIDVIDRRKLWARYGHPSLFEFLVSRYDMSESTAGKRIGAARTARRFPILFRMVERGEIHLSGIHCLKAHLTAENHEHVLASAKHQSMRQIAELVARLAPRPDAPSMLRALPRRADPVATMPAPSPALPAPSPALPAPGPALPAPGPAQGGLDSATASTATGHARAPTPAQPPSRSPDPAPLSPGRYRLQITLGQAARDKLKQLQDLLAHQIPNGDPAAIVERALDALWTQVHKRKTGITAKPRAGQSSPGPSRGLSSESSRDSPRQPSCEPTNKSSHDASRQPSEASHESSGEPGPRPNPAVAPRTRRVKVAARREVWPRDAARCGFIGEDGHHCSETRGLEFAHRQPWARGGADTADNLCLRCITHNALEAERDYGVGFMASKRERKRRPPRP